MLPVCPQFEWFDRDVDTLELEGEYIRYELASNGAIFSGSARQIKEIPPAFTPDQRFSERDPSGFHVGGTNSNQVVDRMENLTGRPSQKLSGMVGQAGYPNLGFLA